MKYKLVLGLEIHLQLNSKKKMFCSCDANIWQAPPNTHTCPVCLGLPGALPVPNFESVKKTQMLGIAFNCRLNKLSHFDRKHYFYPDLPKGYQISQYRNPLCEEGHLVLENGNKVLISRIHLEEDTAKSFHQGSKTLIDFNKSGISLVEIVTKPCFEDVKDALEFCRQVQDISKVLNISDADMEKGNMRLEANVSLMDEQMQKENKLPPYKVEIKNINSFKFMEKAVLYEVQRQTQIYESGQIPKQENRGWDEKKGATLSQRDKEEAQDYRYFPEPDIPPMVFDDDYFEKLKSEMPLLPFQIRERCVSFYNLSEQAAGFFSRGIGLGLWPKFEEAAKEINNFQLLANLLINKPEFRNMPVREIISSVNLSYLQRDQGQTLSDSDIRDIIYKVCEQNVVAVQNYKKGKSGSLEFLVGQVIKSLGYKPKDIEYLRNKIKEVINSQKF